MSQRMPRLRVLSTTLLYATFLVVAPGVASSATSPPISVHSGTKWYWSKSLAESFFHYRRLSNTEVIYRGKCSGFGASKPSDLVNVDLFNEFQCKVSGANFKRMASFDKAVEDARTAVKQATDADKQDAINALLEAVGKQAQYQAHRTFVITK